MPRHDGSRYARSRKQRKRRGRNRQSWLDRAATLTRKGKP